MTRAGGRQTKKLRWLILLIPLFLLSPWIMADASAQNSRPCADDIAKFCKDVKPGGGGIANCLKQHESELSSACKDRVAHAEKRTNEMQACKGDVDKFCKDIKPGGGRIVRCLREHASELSSGCQESISQARKR